MELKVIVPTSLSEITLDQYQRFARLEGDEEFLTHKMLEIFCGVPLAQLPNVKFSSVANVMRHINTMFEEKPSLKPTFTIGEQEFGFIPNLEDITFCVVDLIQSRIILASPSDTNVGDLSVGINRLYPKAKVKSSTTIRGKGLTHIPSNMTVAYHTDGSRNARYTCG